MWKLYDNIVLVNDENQQIAQSNWKDNCSNSKKHLSTKWESAESQSYEMNTNKECTRYATWLKVGSLNN